jgi:class 3 adenylate cyclase/predicted ATPase
MDVGGWLRGLGLGKYEAAFCDNGIDESVLPHLTVEDLKELGVASVGDRRKLLTAISALSSLTPSGHAASTRFSPAPSMKISKVSAERRPITVMFCDLVGSTSLAAKLDAEDWRDLVGAYLDAASEAVTGYGGHVLKKLGDGLMALFGYPQAQENDAERAVRAALAIQRALAELNARNAGGRAPELAARAGIDSGSVVVDATGEVFGKAPNIAARLQALAEPGSVVVTANVQRQVAGLFVAEDKGAHALKGVAEPVALYRIVRASGWRRGGARTLTPLVGRAEELDHLARRWERARAGEGQLALIVGEPGIGKSRLIAEFRARLGETPHTFVEWSSSQLLQNTPLHPIAEWGRLRFGGAETPADRRLADLENTLTLIGLDADEYAPLIAPIVDIPLPPGRALSLAPEELRRRQLAAMTAWSLAAARQQPVALAFEDLHWADPTSLDLMLALAERGAEAPHLILATARPEFRPPWGMRPHHTVIALAPLDRTQVAQMVGKISSRHALSKEVVEGVGERTGGVPLFVEEVTRLLLERGVEGGAQAIPPTLQLSLAARLDRLGPAREIAKVGAVLGRDFSYMLLRDVAEINEPALQASLDRLIDADLLFVEGAPPQAGYRFKHALIQDAAYESLLRSRRQALHRRAAEILRDEPERAAAEPERIAHHFTQAGLDDLAIEWWGRAGDQALRRSAFQEAIAHLGKAIAMADKAGAASSPRPAATTAPASQRLKLQTRLGQAMMYSRGFASGESKTAFARARTLAAGVGDASERFDAYFGLFAGSAVRGELGLARETAESFLREAETEGRMTETAFARRCVGVARLFQGDFIGAEANLAEALRIYDPERNRDARFRFGEDTGAGTAGHLVRASWALGDVERARALSEEALGRAEETGHAPTRANVYHFISLYQMLRGDPQAVTRTVKVLVDLGREHGMALFLAWGEVYSNWARARLGDRESGMTGLREALAAYFSQGNKLYAPLFQGLLAELEAEGNDEDGALRRIDEALALASETGEHWTDALLHRIRGAILLKCDPANTAPAEEAFQTAIAIAKKQGARSYELLASLSLAKLYQSIARPAEAHALLSDAIKGFAPTPEMPEIAEAEALIAELAETDEVKAATAQRERRVKLQTAYARALMWTKGYASEEAKDAFARAREMGGGSDDDAERFPAYYAQFVRSYVRGDWPQARATAETFLREAEERAYATEACAARRCLGAACFFQGDLREARALLERALADYAPDRDALTGFRFGGDTGVLATVHLGLAMWRLGEAGCARQLVEQAIQRAAELGHAPTSATMYLLVALLDTERADPAGVLRSAEMAHALGREHGMDFYVAFGEVLAGWVRGRLHDAEVGAQELRRALADYFDQGNKAWAPLFHGMLAELEAATRGPDAALALIDQGLAIATETGERLTDPYLHRLRGDILLKRNPADPSPAEVAFQTAVAIAKQQGARTYDLLASLSLAKLYDSTGRPAEAHAVLGPALEGLTPTPELPEIAEAEALMQRLA